MIQTSNRYLVRLQWPESDNGRGVPMHELSRASLVVCEPGRPVGIYCLWRDAGFAVGALLTGILADRFGLIAAVLSVAAITAASGMVVALRMYETVQARPRQAGIVLPTL
jgi:hypothetical protein